MKRFTTYIAIDDTDELGYHTSTGQIAQNIQEYITAYFSLKTNVITRHQLLLDPKISYTSHNSAMCFSIQASNFELIHIKNYIFDTIRKEAAPSSSPGICICNEHHIVNRELLVNYGIRAKQEVLSTDDAYNVAMSQNILLEGIRNNDQGVIGALAAVALRVSGEDGTLRGSVKIAQDSVSYEDILALNYFDEIKLINNKELDTSVPIQTKKFLKGNYLHNKIVLLLEEYDGLYHPLAKEKLLNSQTASLCEAFKLDCDEGELLDIPELLTCYNCLYRRWTKESFECMKKGDHAI